LASRQVIPFPGHLEKPPNSGARRRSCVMPLPSGRTVPETPYPSSDSRRRDDSGRKGRRRARPIRRFLTQCSGALQ
jgi:hypothetical protein